ncbi:MAG: hypothetical protein EXQ59_02850 [Acidobacteria bacterium]|nr:hypothetical protein [Acidobacteriota bacterium]
MIVHLVPVGKERFELYAEPPEEPTIAPPRHAWFFTRWSHGAAAKWREVVDEAGRGHSVGGVARWQDALIGRLAENIAEQRTLWGLRGRTSARLLFPASMNDTEARATLNALLAEGRRHHGRWLVVEVILVVGSGLLAIVPGPNLIAYYFLFRLVGHLQSWRGAGDGLSKVSWALDANAGLAELGTLVNVPRAARAARVEAIAAGLNVPRLSAFFDRVAAPAP